jgi:hypothetical protein
MQKIFLHMGVEIVHFFVHHFAQAQCRNGIAD